MTDSDLIAQQAREIAELKERVAAHEGAAKDIYFILYCIGGPLNDNKLGYTREQLKPFFEIATLVQD